MGWGFAIQLGVWAGLYLYSRLTRPKIAKPKPATRDNLSLPRTEEGSPLPMVFGRVRIESPILVWMGQLKSKTTDAGDRGFVINYGLNQLYALGVPMGNGVTMGNDLTDGAPRLWNVWYGDKKLPSPPGGRVPHAGSQLRRGQSVIRTEFLGGPGAGGGIVGIYRFHGGYTDQNLFSPPTPIGDAMTVEGVDASLMPGFRRQMLCSFTNTIPDNYTPPWLTEIGDDPGVVDTSVDQPNAFTIGESPNIDGFSFEVSTYGDKVFSMTQSGYDFGGGADPMEVIYDVLTNPWSKVGLPSTKIDTTSFLAASTVLKAEGHGYSRVHYDNEDAEEIIGAVLRQIDCAMYEEPLTGKLVAKLIREDYVPSSLLILDRTNIVAIEDYSISAWVDAINEVRVSYTEPKLEYKPALAIALSLANAIGSNNRRNAKTVDYPGINNATIAAKVAMRDLNVLARPLAKITITANRDAKDLRPGTCFKVTNAEYNLEEKIFRAQRVDLGQLHENKVQIEAIEDAFASTYAGISFSYQSLERTLPYPMDEQLMIEAPRWMARRARLSGIVGSEDSPRLMAIAPPSLNTKRMYTSTRVRPTNTPKKPTKKPTKLQSKIDILNGLYSKDLPMVAFPVMFEVQTALSRTEEPYIATGLRITNINDVNDSDFTIDFASLTGTETSIRNNGAPMVLIVNPDGTHEFMCFETCALQSPGVYRLDGLWRGLMDTPAIDLALGARGYLISPFYIGRKGYSVGDVVQYAMIPSSEGISGSGGDPYNEHTIVGATFLPLPPSHWGLVARTNYFLQGTERSGRYKLIDAFDGSFDCGANFRDRLAPGLAKGTDAGDTPQEFTPVTTVPYSYKLPTDVTGGGPLGYGAIEAPGGIITGFGTDLVINGYGQHVIEAKTFRTLGVADPMIGLGGLKYLDTIASIRRPSVKAYAYEWRNIAGNDQLDSSTDYFAWSNWTRNTGTFSVTRAAGGAYWQPTSASNTLDQLVGVKFWSPRGLTALAWGYVRNASSDANDSISVNVAALDSTATVITSSAAGSFGPPSAAWVYRESDALAVPALTEIIRFRAVSTEVAVGGTGNPDSCVGRVGIALGQFYNNTLTLLSNASFDTNTASWTVDSGSFTVEATIASPSVGYLRGGSADAEIHQDFTLPVGYEYGTYAVCRFYIGGIVSGGLGSFKLQALDASNNAIAEYFMEEFSSSTGIWTPKLAWLDLPIGSAKVRVIIISLPQSGGVSDAEIGWDEFRLSLHKKLDPAFEQDFDFSAPREQYVPVTWQDFALHYNTLPQPDFVFSGAGFGSSYKNTQDTGRLLEWSDNVAHASANFHGTWNTETWNPAEVVEVRKTGSTVEGFRFTRQSGGGAVCVEARDNAIDTLAYYGEAQSFSVMVTFRVDELTWAGVACGLVGRKDLTAGWGIQIAAGGTLQAVFEGTAGTKTATVSGAVNDGAVHSAILVYDATADTITLYRDGVAGTPVSTAAGLGEFARRASTSRLRVGRSSSSDDSLPGVIGHVYIWDSALTSGNVSTLWVYGKAPAGLTMSYTRNAPAWTQVDDSRTGDAVLLGWSTDQQARGHCAVYTLSAPAPGVEDCGLALAKSNTNLVPSWDFTAGVVWVADGGAVLVQGVEDPTGRLFGVTIPATTTAGLKMVGVTFDATTTAKLVIWAKGTAGQVVSIALLNSSDVVKNTQTITLAATWKRYVVAFTGWDASSATARVRFRANAGSVTFSLAHVMWLGQGAEVPVLYQGPGVAMGDTTASWSNAFTRQLSSEGELYVKGIGLGDGGTSASLMQCNNGTNSQNRREVYLTSTAAAMRHFDGSAASNDSTGSAFSRTLRFELRGRWNRAKTTDATANAFAGVVIDASADSSAYGRTATFTESSSTCTQVVFNSGDFAAWNGVIHYATIRAREEKLP